MCAVGATFPHDGRSHRHEVTAVRGYPDRRLLLLLAAAVDVAVDAAAQSQSFNRGLCAGLVTRHSRTPGDRWVGRG